MSSILERGKFIRTCTAPETLAYFPENKTLVADLFSKYRMEWVLGRDGIPLSIELKEWIVQGRKGQLFEYGKGLLGITIEGPKWTRSFLQQTKSFCTISQRGDAEANLYTSWTAENVAKLAKLLKLHKRRILSEIQKQTLIANLKLLNAQPKRVGDTQELLKPFQGGVERL